MIDIEKCKNLKNSICDDPYKIKNETIFDNF